MPIELKNQRTKSQELASLRFTYGRRTKVETERQHVVKLLPEIEEIKDPRLREKVVDTWLLALQDSQWKRIEDFPWIPGRAEFITNIQHVRGVARVGIAITKAILGGKDVAPDVIINLDTIIASCLLHDVGKMLEYAAPPNSPGQKTPLGKYMMHHILGANLAIKVGLPAEVVHCIESHLEPESFNRSFEAKIVHWSDMAHAQAVLTAHPEVSIF
jgi:putative nucleotidyltransferase with HDIG domain